MNGRRSAPRVTLLQDGDPKDPALFQKADQLVALIEKNMNDLRQELEKAKQAGKSGSSDGDIDAAIFDFTRMVGSYRSLRQNQQAGNFRRMIEDYNRAIEAENHGN